jgi:hypothetical protein
MVEAQTPHGVHSAYIRVYKVFWHIDMPRIGIWVPPYIVRPVKVRFGLSGIWGRQESPCDVMISWLRLKSPVKCIPHPYDAYTKCFSLFMLGIHMWVHP